MLDDDYTAMMGLDDDSEEDGEDMEGEDEEDDGEEPIELGSDEGEELELDDGSEPASGSDVEEEEEDEEEPVDMVSRKNKRKAESVASPVSKRAKRVSFGRDVVGYGKVVAPASVAGASVRAPAAPVPGRPRTKGSRVSKGQQTKAGKKPKRAMARRSRRG